MKYRKILALITAVTAVFACLAGCRLIDNTANMITLNGSYITAGANVDVNGTVASITKAGTYEISGTLDNGQIIVDTIGAVTLVLNNAEITCASAPPVYIKKSRHTVIRLADDSVNTVADGTSYSLPDSAAEPNAALFSWDDLTITGKGSLVVNGNYRDGITSRDGLRIESGDITVLSVYHGIRGRDYLIINGGDISVSAVRDGIRSANTSDGALGFVEINGGTIDIVAGDDGIYAATDVRITGGTVSIITANNGIKSDGSIGISGGTVDIQTDDDGLLCFDYSISGTAAVTVNGEIIT